MFYFYCEKKMIFIFKKGDFYFGKMLIFLRLEKRERDEIDCFRHSF